MFPFFLLKGMIKNSAANKIPRNENNSGAFGISLSKDKSGLLPDTRFNNNNRNSVEFNSNNFHDSFQTSTNSCNSCESFNEGRNISNETQHTNENSSSESQLILNSDNIPLNSSSTTNLNLTLNPENNSEKEANSSENSKVNSSTSSFNQPKASNANLLTSVGIDNTNPQTSIGNNSTPAIGNRVQNPKPKNLGPDYNLINIDVISFKI